MMLRRILARLQEGILRRPTSVLAICAVLILVGIVSAIGVEFRTARSEMDVPVDPEQRKLEALVREAGGERVLVAMVESTDDGDPDIAALRGFADRLAEALLDDPATSSVFHRVPLDWFLDRALYLAPVAEVESALDRLDGAGDGIGAVLSTRSLVALNDGIAGGLEDASGSGVDTTEAVEAAGMLAALLEAQRRFLADPEGVLGSLEREPPLAALAGSNPVLDTGGYLGTRDGRALFVIIAPSKDDDRLPAIRKFVGAAREVATRIETEATGFRVRFAGEPAMTVEEMNTIRRDTVFTSIVAIIGVSVLTLLVFRWRAHALIVLGALAAGVLWSFMWVAATYGYLNMITSAFISTLIGVGVAYGIHPVSEYELEGAHTRNPIAAVRMAYHRTGAPVTVAAVTTSVAFLSIQLMRFRGFAELGVVAAGGVVLCLAAALVMLPAMLVTYGRWRHARDREHRASAVDRIWVERAATRICRYPRTVTVIALGVTAVMAWAAWGIGFDNNLLKLMPRNSEALAAQQRMIQDSDLSPVAGTVAVDDLDALRELRERARSEPAILRFDSALQFLPDDPARSRAAVERLSGILDGVELPEALDPIDAGELRASADRMEIALADASDDAFVAGLGEVAAALEDARAAAEDIATLAGTTTTDTVASWNDGQIRLLDWASALLADLREATLSEAPTVASLPDPIRRRFQTSDGRLLAYLLPTGNVFDTAELDEYVKACRRVSPDAFGYPISFHRVSTRITDGFNAAVAAGGVLVFLILLIDFRSLSAAALAMIPLVIGIVWMLGLMGILGLSFNVANLIAVPLIIGVGIDNGVHVVHRLRLEGERGMGVVLRHTGRAILIASLTTMIGFGSLSLASHRGLESLGLILLLGVGSCLVTSTVVLPNLLVAAGLARE